MTTSQVIAFIRNTIKDTLNRSNTAPVVRSVFENIARNYFNKNSDKLKIAQVEDLTDLVSVKNIPLVKEDLTELAEWALVGPDGKPKIFLGQYVSVKHYAKRGEYDPATDRTFADLRFVENSQGQFIAYGNDGKGFNFGVDAVKVNGSPTEVADSFTKLKLDKPVKKGDKVSWNEIDGINRPYEARQDQAVPVTPPDGTGDDLFWVAYSPIAVGTEPDVRIKWADYLLEAGRYNLVPGQLVEITKRTGGQQAVRFWVLDIFAGATDLAYVRNPDPQASLENTWIPCVYNVITDTTQDRGAIPPAIELIKSDSIEKYTSLKELQGLTANAIVNLNRSYFSVEENISLFGGNFRGNASTIGIETGKQLEIAPINFSDCIFFGGTIRFSTSQTNTGSFFRCEFDSCTMVVPIFRKAVLEYCNVKNSTLEVGGLLILRAGTSGIEDYLSTLTKNSDGTYTTNQGGTVIDERGIANNNTNSDPYITRRVDQLEKPFGISVERADLYLSSEKGDDSLNGLTPATAKKTVASLLPLIQDGSVIGIFGDSYFREQLTIINKNVQIFRYGFGTRPVFDSSDIIPTANISVVDNVYKFDVTPIETSGRTFGFSTFQNDIRLKRVRSLGECKATKGSFWNNAPTIYFNPIEAELGVIECVTRDAGIDVLDSALNCRITGLHSKRGNLNDGVIRIGAAGSRATDCIAEDGTKHTFFVSDDCYIKDCVCLGGEGSDSLFIYYFDATNGSKGTVFDGCKVYGRYAYGDEENGYNTTTGFYCHSKDGIYLQAMRMRNCYVENVRGAYSAQARIVEVDNCSTKYVATAVYGSQISGGTATISNCFFDQRFGKPYQKASGDNNNLLNAGNGFTKFDNNILLVNPERFGSFAYFGGNDCTVEIQSNLFINQNNSAFGGISARINDGRVDMFKSLFYNVGDIYTSYNNSDETYFAEYNNYYRVSGSMKWRIRGTEYNSIEEVRSSRGIDNYSLTQNPIISGIPAWENFSDVVISNPVVNEMLIANSRNATRTFVNDNIRIVRQEVSLKSFPTKEVSIVLADSQAATARAEGLIYPLPSDVAPIVSTRQVKYVMITETVNKFTYKMYRGTDFFVAQGSLYINASPVFTNKCRVEFEYYSTNVI